MVISPENILLVGAILLFLSVLVGKTGAKFGVPALLLFLGVGMLAGSDGFGIYFDSPQIAQFIGTVALCIILFSGGMDTHYREIKPILAPGVTLATLGVLMTTIITGLFIYSLSDLLPGNFQLGLLESMLLAAVMSSTDSASVFSILRSKGISLKERLRPTLELESGSNDPMAYMLTILLIQVIEIGVIDWPHSIVLLFMQLSIGAAAGFALGYAIVWIINRINVPNESLYPVLLFSCVFFVFAFTNLLQGNGYLAVYIAGLVVGNRKLVHKRSLTTFFDGFTWLFQIVMFLTLGLLVNPSELPAVAGVGLLVAIFMIVVSRPISVFACLLPFRRQVLQMGRVDGRLHKIGGFGVDEPLVKAVQRVVQMLPQRRTAVQPLPQLIRDAVHHVLCFPQRADRHLGNYGMVGCFPHAAYPLSGQYARRGRVYS